MNVGRTPHRSRRPPDVFGRLFRKASRVPDRAYDGRAIPSAPRAVAQFVLTGLVAVALFLVVSLFVLQELGRREAIRDAKAFAVLAGQGIVEPALTDGVLRNDREALDRIDWLVQERVLSDRVVRVKLWTSTGRIVYSDEPRLVGLVFPLTEDDAEVLRSGRVHAELSDLSDPENRFDRGQGPLYEVYTRVRTPKGTPLLFEAYQRSSSLVRSGRSIWLPFAVPLLASLLLLWLVQAPLAWRLARRLGRSQAEREDLLLRAVEASTDERRRIAASLHDGVVQDLVGLSYSLSAAGDRSASQDASNVTPVLRDGASRTRDAIRQLRTLLVEIHPPNLRSTGLGAALTDLLAPLTARGIEIDLDMPDDLSLDADTEVLVFRAAAEAARNIQEHAEARSVAVRLLVLPQSVRLEISDDGVGFTAEQLEERRAEGHVGLSLLEEFAERQGGSLEVRSTAAGGTSFVLEVPRS